MGEYTKVYDKAQYKKALGLARGSYQQNLIRGRQAWSGADLRGRAGHWGSQYKRSRDSLLRRLKKAGIEMCWPRKPHNKLVLVIGKACPVTKAVRAELRRK